MVFVAGTCILLGIGMLPISKQSYITNVTFKFVQEENYYTIDKTTFINGKECLSNDNKYTYISLKDAQNFWNTNLPLKSLYSEEMWHISSNICYTSINHKTEVVAGILIGIGGIIGLIVDFILCIGIGGIYSDYIYNQKIKKQVKDHKLLLQVQTKQEELKTYQEVL